MRNKKTVLIIFLLLMVIAAFFRFYLISELPGGLFPDEAANGLDVNQIIDGKPQAFYERGNGREALFFYLLVPAVEAFGRTPLAHHFTSASLGFLTVLLTLFLTWRWFNVRIAIVATTLTAVSAWHVTLSRTAFRAISAPVFTLLFFIFATRVIQSKSRLDYWGSSILAGVSLSLGFYTYISARMMVPLLLGAIIILLIIDFRRTQRWQILKQYWQAIIAGVSASIITFAPLGWFFIRNPEWIVGRGGQVSITSPDLNQGDLVGTFFTVFGKTIAAFFTQGDANWRHNVSGEPFLSPLIAAFFAVGVFYIVAMSTLFVIRAFKGEKGNEKLLPIFLLTLWFFLMLVPEVLTGEGIPHGLRLIGIIPVVFIIPALMIEKMIDWFYKKLPHFKKHLNEVFTVAIIVVLVLETVAGFNLYFNRAKESPEYYAAFRSDLTVVSDYLNLRANKEQTFLVIDFFSEQTPQYMTTQTQQPYHVVDPGTLWQGPASVRIDRDDEERFGLGLRSGDQVIFTQSTIFDTAAFEKHFPQAGVILEKKNQWNEVIMRVYQR